MKISALVFLTMFSLSVFAQDEAEAPDPVSWTIELSSTEDLNTVSISAVIEEGWHVYGLKLENDLGPLPTIISFEEGDLEWQELVVPKPSEKYDDMFMMNVSYYENEVTFSRAFKGDFDKVKGFVEFMVCNDSMCLPPTTVDFELAQE